MANHDAIVFAEEAYDKGDASSKTWETYIKRIGFEKEVKDDLYQELGIYRDKVMEVTNNLFEDVYFSMKNAFDSDNIFIPLKLDLRATTRIAGGIMGIAGTIAMIALESNPIGWVLLGIGVLLELGSSLFQTREQKRQKGVDKIYHSIRKEIEKNAEAEIDKTVNEVALHLSRKTDEVESLFDQLSEGMNRVLNYSEQLSKEYSKEIERLNTFYALRILQFLNSANNNNFTWTSNDILSVNREQHQMIITLSNNIPSLDTELLRDVIAEKVVIERRG